MARYSWANGVMISASCYFRGNYMNVASARSLLTGFCAEPELVPDKWNIFEPINRPFSPDNSNEVVAALAPSSRQVRSLVFFAKKRKPSFLLTVDLRLAPVQGGTPHNSIHFRGRGAWNGWTGAKHRGVWNGSEHVLASYLPRSVQPRSIDYASIPDWKDDKDRYKEFNRSYTGKEMVEMLSKREITAPFGPFGCLADVHWFNYFGQVYVEAIGRERLLAAGWELVDEIGEGLACYATKEIDAVNSRERRSAIATAIQEFVWSPGCNRDEKKIPDFDYSEQLAALPAEALDKIKSSAGSSRVHFAGLSAEEEEQAKRTLGRDGDEGSTSPRDIRHRTSG
jgi:hypothetical protein